MNDRQHGFRRGRSCLSQSLKLIEEGEAVDVKYLDFAKAFDKVDQQDHGVLLIKLRKLRIGGDLLTWLQDFLSERQQCMAVDGAESIP